MQPRSDQLTTHATPRHPAISRRALIQAGAIGILGLGMAEREALRALAGEGAGAGTGGGAGDLRRARDGASRGTSSARAAIYIFLSGGLSHLDSFDLKPEAPGGIRGEFRPIPTRTDGIQICEHLPLLAARSASWAIVRSLTHPWDDHSQGHLSMLTGHTAMPEGFDPNQPKPNDWPSLASVANHVITTDAARRGNLPPAVVLPHGLIHRTGRTIPGQFAGRMGARWDPYFIESAARCEGYGACPQCFHFERGAIQHTSWPAFHTPSLTLPEGVDRSRFSLRLSLLEQIESQQRGLEAQAQVQGLGRAREQAISILADPRTRDAFDVLGGEPRTLERYGQNQFGWSLLMARRLVERGVSLVQVNLGNNETWDTHQGAFPILRDQLLPPLDRALSALLDDLHASGLLESTLVVMGSEFGRTPRISKLPGASLAGRDHWGAAQTVFFAGGGVRGGAVIGSTDKHGAHPASDPQTPEGMAATIYRALGIPRTAAWHDPVDRPYEVYGGEPIAGLM